MKSHQTLEQKEAVERIKAIDSTLSIHRQAWEDASPDRKPEWWRKIDALLDQRLGEMAVRDGLVAVLV